MGGKGRQWEATDYRPWILLSMDPLTRREATGGDGKQHELPILDPMIHSLDGWRREATRPTDFGSWQALTGRKSYIGPSQTSC